MSIVIDRDKCVSCGRCAAVCPGSLIDRDGQGHIYMRYPKDCWGCSSCIKECAFSAISLYLGADMGGMGSRMSVKDEKDRLVWSITDTSGGVKQIITDKREANKY